MITNTNAFFILKQQIQSSIDFSVLCCQAVPALKAYIKAVEKGSAPKLPDADHFKGDPNFDQLKGYIPEYRKNLGKLMFINSFSYFEAYFKSLIAEVLEFHGGKDAFVDRAKKRQHQHLVFAEGTDTKKSANKLREYAKPSKSFKYIKYTNKIEHTDFRFPSELFAAFGIFELGTNYSDLKASQIPHVAQLCFGVDLTESEVESFSSYRNLRNSVAHGQTLTIDFNEANAANSFLRSLALKIDKHVVKHFLVIEI
ncbi:HEPN domain-containing protein [Pseudomonas siliginis]|uniref:HEPN domain-containing protein n=1 Tax=Pseudomonas siliginis TaxID=2842346 RepID=UPI001C3E7AAB|nr:HEPN domain-containing protein [Pseudomonas siliginis]MBV4469923.1 Abi family protein [Pseudomonas siliginis]